VEEAQAAQSRADFRVRHAMPVSGAAASDLDDLAPIART